MLKAKLIKARILHYIYQLMNKETGQQIIKIQKGSENFKKGKKKWEKKKAWICIIL